MRFMAFSSVPGAQRAVKVNQPTPITASTSCTSSVWSGKKRNRGRGMGVIGTLSKGENTKQGKDQRKMYIIIYAGSSFLIAEKYLVGLKSLWDRDCGLDLQIHRYIEFPLTFLGPLEPKYLCYKSKHLKSFLYLIS